MHDSRGRRNSALPRSRKYVASLQTYVKSYFPHSVASSGPCHQPAYRGGQSLVGVPAACVSPPALTFPRRERRAEQDRDDDRIQSEHSSKLGAGRLPLPCGNSPQRTRYARGLRRQSAAPDSGPYVAWAATRRRACETASGGRRLPVPAPRALNYNFHASAPNGNSFSSALASRQAG